MALTHEQLPEWAQFWNWFGGGSAEAGGPSTAEIQTQLNNLNLGNVSTGDVCNWLETAYHRAGGDGGGFHYPPAGSTPAQAVAYYQQHITVDAAQNWNFHAEGGSVINLGNVGGDVITNPELNLEYHEGQGYQPPEGYQYEPEQVPESAEGEGYEGEAYEPPEGEGYEGEAYEPPEGEGYENEGYENEAYQPPEGEGVPPEEGYDNEGAEQAYEPPDGGGEPPELLVLQPDGTYVAA